MTNGRRGLIQVKDGIDLLIEGVQGDEGRSIEGRRPLFWRIAFELRLLRALCEVSFDRLRLLRLLRL